MLRDEPPIGQTPQTHERVRHVQPIVTSAVRKLKRLRDKLNFTNPAAVRWFQDKLRRLLDMGVDCFKTDFGEEIPTEVVYHDGSDPERMRNYYTYLYNRAVFELLEETLGQAASVTVMPYIDVVAEGMPLPRVSELLDDPRFVSGDYDTGIVARMR